MKDICNENGFSLEEFKVTTEDGYILTLFRIPGTLKEMNSTASTDHPKRKPIVLMQHGLEGDSSEFILHAPSKAPAFTAVRYGFDVWLGNNRGNRYSLGHVSLNSNIDKAAYWDFDFEDMGLKDLPA